MHANTLKIGFIGCGKLGGPTADLLDDLGYDVRRYDIAENHGYTHAEACADRDLILIAVPTPHSAEYDGSIPITGLPAKDFDYSMLQVAVLDASEAAPGTPIVIISTCLPGTMRKLFSEVHNEIIYNPYLISMGAVQDDLKNPDIVIIGTRDGHQTDAVQKLRYLHYEMAETSINGSIHQGTWEEAESIKIFYNTFISTKLGLVNMIQDVAQSIGNMNVDVVTDALQDATLRITGPRYMKAGMGDGGPCHPRDNIALRWLSQELDLGYDLFSAIMGAREFQARNLAKFLVDVASKYGQQIYIHGKTFKPDVPYCDGSYSLLVGHYVTEISGRDPIYIDPHTDPVAGGIHGTILLAHNPGVTYNHMSHKDIAIYCDFLPGSKIVDPWRSFETADPSIEVIHYGNTRRTT